MCVVVAFWRCCFHRPKSQYSAIGKKKKKKPADPSNCILSVKERGQEVHAIQSSFDLLANSLTGLYGREK